MDWAALCIDWHGIVGHSYRLFGAFILGGMACDSLR